MKIALIAILLAVLVLVSYIRLAPSDPAMWHVDPLTADDPGAGGVLVRHAVAARPQVALARFDDIARASPRIATLAGSVADGHITYLARSKWIGFPDYITVKSVATETGSDLVILSRLRFGGSDLGVNAARLDRWLEALQPVQ